MRTAMIWGASGGIGRAFVKRLTDDGWHVIALARRVDNVHNSATSIHEIDVDSPETIERAVLAASQEVEEVNLWVYAIGDIILKKIQDLVPEEWTRIVKANLTGAYLASHYSLPLLADDAHLVFIGAVSERLHLPGLAPYVATKAGLEAIAETLRKEESDRRVTLVRPSSVATSFWEKVPFSMPSNAQQPEDLTEQVLRAVEEGHSGVLNLH
jgi:NADP-dependent 3-hydroxy acid dehydrogenase YdfG